MFVQIADNYAEPTNKQDNLVYLSNETGSKRFKNISDDTFKYKESFNDIFIKPTSDILSSYFDKLISINKKEIITTALQVIQKNRLAIKNGLEQLELISAQDDLFSLGLEGITPKQIEIKLSGINIDLSSDRNKQYFNNIIREYIFEYNHSEWPPTNPEFFMNGSDKMEICCYYWPLYAYVLKIFSSGFSKLDMGDLFKVDQLTTYCRDPFSVKKEKKVEKKQHKKKDKKKDKKKGGRQNKYINPLSAQVDKRLSRNILRNNSETDIILKDGFVEYPVNLIGGKSKKGKGQGQNKDQGQNKYRGDKRQDNRNNRKQKQGNPDKKQKYDREPDQFKSQNKSLQQKEQETKISEYAKLCNAKKYEEVKQTLNTTFIKTDKDYYPLSEYYYFNNIIVNYISKLNISGWLYDKSSNAVNFVENIHKSRQNKENNISNHVLISNNNNIDSSVNNIYRNTNYAAIGGGNTYVERFMNIDLISSYISEAQRWNNNPGTSNIFDIIALRVYEFNNFKNSIKLFIDKDELKNISIAFERIFTFVRPKAGDPIVTTLNIDINEGYYKLNNKPKDIDNYLYFYKNIFEIVYIAEKYKEKHGKEEQNLIAQGYVRTNGYYDTEDLDNIVYKNSLDNPLNNMEQTHYNKLLEKYNSMYENFFNPQKQTNSDSMTPLEKQRNNLQQQLLTLKKKPIKTNQDQKQISQLVAEIEKITEQIRLTTVQSNVQIKNSYVRNKNYESLYNNSDYALSNDQPIFIDPFLKVKYTYGEMIKYFKEFSMKEPKPTIKDKNTKYVERDVVFHNPASNIEYFYSEIQKNYIIQSPMFMLPDKILKIIRQRVIFLITFILNQLDIMYLNLYEKYSVHIIENKENKPANMSNKDIKNIKTGLINNYQIISNKLNVETDIDKIEILNNLKNKIIKIGFNIGITNWKQDDELNNSL